MSDIRNYPRLKMDDLYVQRDINNPRLYWILLANGTRVNATINAGDGWSVERTGAGILIKPQEEVEIVKIVVKKPRQGMERRGEFDGQGRKLR